MATNRRRSRARASKAGAKAVRSVEEFRELYLPNEVRRERLRSGDPAVMAEQLAEDSVKEIRRRMASHR
jgi:hypothetical protein